MRTAGLRAWLSSCLSSFIWKSLQRLKPKYPKLYGPQNTMYVLKLFLKYFSEPQWPFMTNFTYVLYLQIIFVSLKHHIQNQYNRGEVFISSSKITILERIFPYADFWTPATHSPNDCDIFSVCSRCHRLITASKVSPVGGGVFGRATVGDVGWMDGVSLSRTGYYVTRAPPPSHGLRQEVWAAFCHSITGGRMAKVGRSGKL